MIDLKKQVAGRKIEKIKRSTSNVQFKIVKKIID